jgi:DNA-binding GntR family transcriptional regulator
VSLSKDDPRPPYIQVSDDLREQIDGGRLKPGQRLPSGRELAKAYGVALQTVQRAVDTLKLEGLLVSYPPRGVFVRTEELHAHQRSPEYVEIMRHLEGLESAIAQVDERLTKLERAADARRAKSSRRPQGSSRRGD